MRTGKLKVLLFLFLASYFLFLVLIPPACGKKGPPKVPMRYIPGAVEDLVAAPKENNVLLSWKRPEKNEDDSQIKDLAGFLILRAEIPQGTDDCRFEYQQIFSMDIDKPEPAIIKGTLITFLDKGGDLSPPGLVYSKTYGYKVLSINKSKILSKEKESRVTLSVPPGRPEGFKAIPGEVKATLSWMPPVKRMDGSDITDLKGYALYRTREKGVYSDIPVNPGLIISLTYTDQNLENNKTYYYIVKAVNTLVPPWNEGPASEEISVTPQKTTAPEAPKRLIAVLAEGKIFLTWDENTESFIKGYKVYRSINPKKGYNLITPEPIINTTFTDRNVLPNRSYYYRVTAIDNAPIPNESLPSEEATAQMR